MRKGLHSNTSLHTPVPGVLAAIHDQRSLQIWRDGASKGEAHLALQLEGEGQTTKVSGAVKVPTEKIVIAPKPDEHIHTLGSIHRFLRLELYWPVISALKSSPDSDAAAAVEYLHSRHANVELQRSIFKLLNWVLHSRRCYQQYGLEPASSASTTKLLPASIPLKSSPPLPPPPQPSRQLPPFTLQT